MTLFIKNMVCDRCIQVVHEDLNHAGYKVRDVKLGKVILYKDVNDVDLNKINTILKDRGFELLESRSRQMIETIKNLIIDKVHYANEPLIINFSYLLENELGTDYHYLSKLFSSIEGITIEKFIILQKIEKVKELLFYDELSLSEIAYKLGYSSVQHLSNQFKKAIGMSPSQYKKVKGEFRNTLDNVIK